MKAKRLILIFQIVLLSGCLTNPSSPSKSTSLGLRPISPLCLKWSTPEVSGKLEHRFLAEASGLTVSARFPRLYHINDSGDGGVFYWTNRDGSGTRRVQIEGFHPVDTEDLSLGACGAGKTCLMVADIGDNRVRRKSIEIVFVEELESFDEKTRPWRRLVLTYPDGAHNAEAFGVHPNGDLFIVTKEMVEKTARAAQVFRLPRAHFQDVAKGPLVLQAWGRLDVPQIVAATGYEGLVTGMSIAPQGDRFLLLTYDRALEIAWDLGRAPLPSGEDLATKGQLSVISIRRLNQQEAISYDKNGRDLLYHTEREQVLGVGTDSAEIMSLRCLQPGL